MGNYAAIDLGASSGRIAVGSFQDNKFELDIVHRFDNYQLSSHPGQVTWDWQKITSEILKGLRIARQKFTLDSVAVDSWAVDYVLFDPDGNVAAPTYSYRDDRSDGRMEIIQSDFDTDEIYRHTGIQFQPFNTTYQLLAAKESDELNNNSFLLFADAINKFLCSSNTTERTNASTTQLYDHISKDWYWSFIDSLGLPRAIFPKIHDPLTRLGVIQGHGDLDGIPVVAVGSHDTASAIAGTPLTQPSNEIYISSGTWSLVGAELDRVITSGVAKQANLTNELGVEHKIRLIKNVSGMWIISECIREWASAGQIFSIQELIDGASEIEIDSRIDPSDPIFLPPGKMVERINYCLRLEGYTELENPFEIVRCVFESLADSYKLVAERIVEVTGMNLEHIHVVGGGSANSLLNQLTADATGVNVSAGPIEATLLGNLGVQAMAAGEIKNLQHLRQLIKINFPICEYLPRKGNCYENVS